MNFPNIAQKSVLSIFVENESEYHDGIQYKPFLKAIERKKLKFMLPSKVKDLCLYRIEKAKGDLEAAQTLAVCDPITLLSIV